MREVWSSEFEALRELTGRDEDVTNSIVMSDLASCSEHAYHTVVLLISIFLLLPPSLSRFSLSLASFSLSQSNVKLGSLSILILVTRY